MSEQDEKNIKLAAIITASIIAVYMATKFIKGVGETFDALNPWAKDDTDKRVDAAAERAEKLGYFNPAFIKNAPAGTALLTKKNADIKARNIWDSIGFIYDDPIKTKAAFSNIVTKSQVSHLAKVFYDTYKKDLLSFLTQKLDTDEQQKILSQIIERLNGLPDYFNPNQSKTTPIVKPPSLNAKQKPLFTYKPLFDAGKI